MPVSIGPHSGGVEGGCGGGPRRCECQLPQRPINCQRPHAQEACVFIAMPAPSPMLALRVARPPGHSYVSPVRLDMRATMSEMLWRARREHAARAWRPSVATLLMLIGVATELLLCLYWTYSRFAHHEHRPRCLNASDAGKKRRGRRGSPVARHRLHAGKTPSPLPPPRPAHLAPLLELGAR